ncbi:MAG: amidohydrolase family protein, partial [Lacipirellulaceae bacterium]
MKPLSLRARWVLPMDTPAIEDGMVTISGGKIVEVGRAAEFSGPCEDLGDVALIPGLVNAHTHLEFSDQQAPLGPADEGLPAWIRSVIADRQRGNRDAKAAIQKGLAESLEFGVTTVAEIATSPASYYYADSDIPNLLLLAEAIGFSHARADSVFQGLEHQIAGYLEKCNIDSGVAGVGVSPHAPYTVSLKLLDTLIELAVANRYPVAMHLAESEEELQLLRANDGPFQELLDERSMWDPEVIPLGTRPLDYLKR